MKAHLEILEAAKIIGLSHETETAHLNWNPHPKCRGVALKHLLTGETTDGKLSCHLVRIQAGCEISEHIHAEQFELHEVVSGQGTGVLVDKEISYLPGTTVIIPANKPHKVIAGKEDVYLLAKFTPALL